MCEWGTDVLLSVPIPASLSYDGKERWAIKPVDSCIAPLIQALNDAGLYTANCCCGHGKGDGLILMHDGSRLLIQKMIDQGR